MFNSFDDCCKTTGMKTDGSTLDGKPQVTTVSAYSSGNIHLSTLFILCLKIKQKIVSNLGMKNC
jgi:hypothetical protein